MNRGAVVIGIIALLIGLGAGYLWWGVPTGRLRTELDEARRMETARPDEAEALRARVKALEEDLAQERLMRSRLEAIVSAGRK